MIDIGLSTISIEKDIARRAKQRRMEQHLTQSELAQKADIPVSTYRLFEQRGSVSLSSLVKVAFALGCIDDFNSLFANQRWANIDDMLKSADKQRVRHD